jgi:DNA-binding CsgD family transcriptional regulator/tetratricopeptide (TPR) repeat protein
MGARHCIGRLRRSLTLRRSCRGLAARLRAANVRPTPVVHDGAVRGAETDLELGRLSHANAQWLDACVQLSRADADARLSRGDLELLATSAYMLGRDSDYVASLDRAHRSHLDAGDVARAARCAFWIGHNLLFRGDHVNAGGWFARAQRLLGDQDCVERGYLLIPAWLAEMGRGNYEQGLAMATNAAAIGERFGDLDLTWLARDEQGRALLNLGRTEEGLRLVDEALIIATSGDLSPIVTGIVYCNTLAFCQDALELAHAREWTQALTRWCDRQPSMVEHNGLCQVHRAEVLEIRGAWTDALAAATRGAERFDEGVLNQIAAGKARYRQGEIRRLRGEFAAAERVDALRSARATHGLTDREVQVLRLVAAGRSNREIAADLVISEHTVARHLQNILAKIDAPSRTAASAFAHQHNLL